jgi:hypothetical protein
LDEATLKMLIELSDDFEEADKTIEERTGITDTFQKLQLVIDLFSLTIFDQPDDSEDSVHASYVCALSVVKL